MKGLKPVFIADTCIGGLSVVKSLWDSGSASDAIYLADYAINPLGVKNDSAIEDVIYGAANPAYTYTDAEFKKAPFDGNNIPAVPEHTAHIGVSIHDVIPGFVFSTSYNYVGSSYLISDQANALKKLDDYSTVDCKLSYKVKSVEAFFGINNLTNEEYSEYGVVGFGGTRNFYPAPGRNWFMGLNFAL